MTIDERIEALTMNLELAWHEIEAQRETSGRILGAVEKLLVIAEGHERRLTRIKGGE